jgi:hypothetical protein
LYAGGQWKLWQNDAHGPHELHAEDAATGAPNDCAQPQAGSADHRNADRPTHPSNFPSDRNDMIDPPWPKDVLSANKIRRRRQGVNFNDISTNENSQTKVWECQLSLTPTNPLSAAD